MTLADNEIDEMTFFTMPDGDIFPEKDLPENSRLLKGFVWRGKEKILSKDDIFDEDDNNIQLVTIQGVDNPIDLDISAEEAVEEERKRDSISTAKVPLANPIEVKAEPKKNDNSPKLRKDPIKLDTIPKGRNEEKDN
jgi:hypothetical protein